MFEPAQGGFLFLMFGVRVGDFVSPKIVCVCTFLLSLLLLFLCVLYFHSVLFFIYRLCK